MNRRRFLLAVGSAGSVAVAGCIEGGDDSGDDSSGDGSSSSSGDGSSGDGSSDDGSSSSDDGMGSASGEIDYEESFVMEFSNEESGMQGVSSITVRVNGQNSYMTFDGPQEIEFYYVDGDSYTVMGGQCFQGQQSQVQSPDAVPEPGEDWNPTAGLATDPDGRETIDGEEMLVYSYSGEGEVYQGADVTAYVSAETEYLRRVEAESWAVDYHTWGEVEPIEAPDMECQDVSGGGGDGGYGGGGSGDDN